MSEPRAIPGFFYDPEKRKYFRIQPNHKTQPNAVHSKQNVDARERERQRQAEQHADIQRRKTNRIVRRHDLATNPRLQSLLGRPTGAVLHGITSSYATALHPSIADKGRLKELRCLDISPQGELYVAGCANLTYDIIHSTRDRAPRAIVTDISTQSGPLYLRTIGESVFAVGASTSLSIFRPASSSSILLRPNPRTEIFDLATHPASTTLAYACEHGLSTCDTTSFATATCRTVTSLTTEQMVLTFQSPHLILSGERSGAVNFTDIRAPETVYRLQHSSAVNGIVSARNANQIIVCGLASISLYDLRLCRARPPRPVPVKARQGKFSRSGPIPRPAQTEPFVAFHAPRDRTPDYFQSTSVAAYLPDVDVLAIHTSRASVSTHNPNRVTLYNASTGRILDSPLTNMAYETAIYGLKSARMRDGAHSIFVLTQDELQEWSVDNRHDSIGIFVQQTSILGESKFPSDARAGVVKLYEDG